MKIARKRNRAGRWIGVVCTLGLLAAGAVYILQIWPHSSPVVPAATAPPAPTVQRLESRMLVMGDVYWGRYINDWSQKSPLKFAYPFSRLGEFHRDQYDAWVADMECPITSNPKVSSAVEDSTLQFDCSPDYLPEAKKWFTAFTLANNHTDNQGPAGFAETKQHLEAQGIQHFGHYDPEDYTSICEVLSLPARVNMSDGATKQRKLPMVWCGYHGVFKTPTNQSIAVEEKYSSLFNVVAMPHSGKEYQPGPDELKTTLYRSLIDAGADVVLGDHPHWVQSSEAYKGKLIVYSMGNFIFDQQFNLEVTRSAPVEMTVSVGASEAPDLDKWLALGETCTGHGDDCLVKAAQQGLKKLPLKYHFALRGSRDDGKLVHPATETELASIKERVKWAATIKGLSGASSGE